MALIKAVKGVLPIFGNDCWFAENSTIVGDVKTGDQCSFWFNSVLRGDVNGIILGNKVNVQDGAIIHCTYLKYATFIGNEVSIGHNAIVHGCTIHDQVLVGMGAIIMDGAIVNSQCIVAAGAIVLENSILESGYIYAGIPAKKIKPLTEEQKSGIISRIAENYTKYSTWFE